MVCKNCGANLKDNAVRCYNCGHIVESNYSIDITSYEPHKTSYKKASRRRTKKITLSVIISIVLVIALAGGSYLFFDYQHSTKDAPSLTFNTGTGIINNDKKIVYLTIDDASGIEYIHGVKIYNGDKPITAKTSDPISTKYEYTKDSAEAVRSIFFYAEDIGVKKGEKYNMTFEMTFSFNGDNNFYTYYQAVSFDGDIKADASDIIFDHSLKPDEDVEIPTTAKPIETTQSSNEPVDASYIYQGFWFTAPVTVNDTLTISAWSINRDSTINVTTYIKAGTANWTTTSSTLNYTQDGAFLMVVGGDENMIIKIDSAEKSLTQVDSDKVSAIMNFTNRLYNSVQNAEGFFGI